MLAQDCSKQEININARNILYGTIHVQLCEKHFLGDANIQ
jgi:hypothetical protein